MQDIHTIQTGKSVKQMFWAGFGYNQRTGSVPLDGDPNSQHSGVTSSIISDLYQSYLPDIVHPGDIFMHDNTPVYTAAIIQTILAELGVEVMIWPPYSLDMNPIENLWALMKSIIYECYPELEKAPNNRETLIIIIIIIIHTRICQPCLAEWRQVQRGGRVSRRSGNH